MPLVPPIQGEADRVGGQKDMALPLTLTVAVKHVGKILGRQLALGGEGEDGRAQLLHVIAATLAKLHLAFEFAGKLDCVHGYFPVPHNIFLTEYKFFREKTS